MKQDLTAVMRQPRRWKYENGVAKLVLGGLFLEAGVALPFGITYVSLALAAGMFIVAALGDWLQPRYIYPRSGFAEFREDTTKRFWRLLLAAVGVLAGLGVVMAILVRYSPENSLVWAAPIVLALAGGLWMIAGSSYGLRRLVVNGGFSICFGLILSPVILGQLLARGTFGMAGLVLYLLIMSITFFVFGGLTLMRFLLNTRPQEDALLAM